MTSVAGMFGLVRLIARRDRMIVPLWLGLLAVLPLITVVAFANLFPEEVQRRLFFTVTAGQPSYVALLGPGFGPSLGALATQRTGIIFVLIALASILTVIRHTRTEEETGRRELLGATVVGRHAPLTAALVVVVALNLVLGLLIVLGLTSQHLPLVGSFAFGLSVAAAGCVFAAIAAVAAQLAQSAGGARGITFAALGLAFLLRAAGDTAGAGVPMRWLSWLSPIGWMQQARPFSGERWWVFALAGALFVALSGLAYLLSSRRDVGSGFFPVRLGAATAAPALRNPLALAWRLHQGLFWGWLAGLGVFGAVVGAIARTASDAMRENPQLEELIRRFGGTGDFTDTLLSSMMGFVGFVASGYAVQAALRPRSEEDGLRGELVLATSVGRLRWLASHLCFALVGPAAAVGVFGIAAGAIFGLTIGDVAGQVPRVLAAALVQLPAIWLLAGVAIALYGLLPRRTSLAWGLLAGFFFLGQFGPVLRLPQWMLDLSPFIHIPRLPGGEVSLTPIFVLLAIALASISAGFASFKRRDFGV